MYENQPWLKHYGETPVSLNYPELSMYAMLKKSCELSPNDCALVFFGKKTTRARLDERIIRISRRFAQIGIEKGDMVIICLPNIPQAVVAFYALNRMGAIPAPVHPLSTAPEIEAYAKLVSAKAAITLDDFFPRFSGIIKSAVLKKVIVCSIKPELGFPAKIKYSFGSGRKIKPVPYSDTVVNWAKLESQEDLPEPETPDTAVSSDSAVSPDSTASGEMALILFSGGTTTQPKAVMLTDRNCNVLAMQMSAAGGPIVPGDKMLSILPLFHGFGFVVGIHSFLINGGICILIPKFRADAAANLVKKYKPQFMAAVPSLYDALAADKNFCKVPLTSFKGFFCGGDLLNPESKKRFEIVLRKGGSNAMLREGYGLAETVTACTITPRNEYRERTIGIPCPDNWLKVVKTGTQEECAAMEEGEICVSGPAIMLGYYNDQNATDEVLKKHDDGRIWLHTGDIGCMDDDGFFYFKQRSKRIIKTSGMAVNPSNIEDVLNRHNAVHSSCVIGVPDAAYGEAPKAFVQLNSSYYATEDLKREIIENCKRQLVPYSCPQIIEFIDEMPKTLIGKVAYRELEERERNLWGRAQ
jgi:long-chain acyl-CoA synthetase